MKKRKKPKQRTRIDKSTQTEIERNVGREFIKIAEKSICTRAKSIFADIIAYRKVMYLLVFVS